MAAEQPNSGEELERMSAEPLLPVEKKLIGWGLGLCAALLAVLVRATATRLP